MAWMVRVIWVIPVRRSRLAPDRLNRPPAPRGTAGAKHHFTVIGVSGWDLVRGVWHADGGNGRRFAPAARHAAHRRH
jgi:hypothetical protein